MKPLMISDFAQGARWQRTFHVDGCRVLMWRLRSGKIWTKVTDPAGNYALELRVLAHVAGVMAEVHIARGAAINIGRPRLIADHEPEN